MRKIILTLAVVALLSRTVSAVEWYEKTNSNSVVIFDWDKLFHAFTERMAAVDPAYRIPSNFPGAGMAVYPEGTNIIRFMSFDMYEHMWTELRRVRDKYAALSARGEGTWVDYLQTPISGITNWAWTTPFDVYLGPPDCDDQCETARWLSNTDHVYPEEIPTWEDRWPDLFPYSEIGATRTYKVNWSGYTNLVAQGWELPTPDVWTFQTNQPVTTGQMFEATYTLSGISVWPRSVDERHLHEYVLWEGNLKNGTLTQTRSETMPMVYSAELPNQPWRGLLDETQKPFLYFTPTGSNETEELFMRFPGVYEHFYNHVITNAATFLPQGINTISNTLYSGNYILGMDPSYTEHGCLQSVVPQSRTDQGWLFPPSEYLRVVTNIFVDELSVSSTGGVVELAEQYIHILSVTNGHDGSIIVSGAGSTNFNGVYHLVGNAYVRDGGNEYINEITAGSGYWYFRQTGFTQYYRALTYSPGDEPQDVDAWEVRPAGLNPAPTIVENPEGGLFPSNVTGKVVIKYPAMAQYGDRPKHGLILAAQVKELVSLIEAYRESTEPSIWIGNEADYPDSDYADYTTYGADMFNNNAWFYRTPEEEAIDAGPPMVAAMRLYVEWSSIFVDWVSFRYARFAKAAINKDFGQYVPSATIRFFSKPRLPADVIDGNIVITYEGSDYDAHAVSGSEAVKIECQMAVSNSCDNLEPSIGTPDIDRSDLLSGLATTSTWTEVAVVTNWYIGPGFGRWAVSDALPESLPTAVPPLVTFETPTEPFACGDEGGLDWQVIDRQYAEIGFWSDYNFYDAFDLDYIPSGSNWATEVGLTPFRGIEYSPDGFAVIEWDFDEP